MDLAAQIAKEILVAILENRASETTLNLDRIVLTVAKAYATLYKEISSALTTTCT